MQYTNEQPIEKADKSPGDVLDIHSVFYTIQGEGPFTGHPAVFVRLAGCNLQCPSCDTDYTSGRVRRSVAVVMSMVREALADHADMAQLRMAPLVVITGGEPFRQNITFLCKALIREGFRVQVETNGTLPPSRDLPESVYIICSPKTGKIHPAIEARAMAFKYVVKAGQVMSDGLPSRALDHTCMPHVARPPAGYSGFVYVQPMDERNNSANRRNLDCAKKAAMLNGHILQIQVHKLIDME